MPTLELTQPEMIEKVIEASRSGQFFSLTFAKKTGELREMSCRGKVAHWTKPDGSKGMILGTGPKNDPTVTGLVKVWDRVAKDYRSVIAGNVVVLKYNRVIFVVKGGVTIQQNTTNFRMEF